MSRMKIVSAALAAAVLCGTATAQMNMGAKASTQPAAADQTGFVGLFSFMSEEVVSVADAMPADKYDFAPKQEIFKDSWKTDFANPKPVRSFAEQVKHIAQANYFFFGTGENIPAEAKAISPLKTKAEIMEALRKSVEYAKSQVAMMNGSNAWSATKIDGIETTRAGRVAFGIAHMNDHMGQLSIYLRMNGIIPPQSRK